MAVQRGFFGRWAVAAAFMLAFFGWGVGFYGPPIFLYEVVQRTGWSPFEVSLAISVHFLSGAWTVSRLNRHYARWGLPRVSLAGAFGLGLGAIGWGLVQAPWQLFVVALVSGAGWALLGPAAVNAVVAPWYARRRPAALGMAYNGATVGGVVFSPLWVALIASVGLSAGAGIVTIFMVGVVGLLAQRVLGRTPAQLGQPVDGMAAPIAAADGNGASEPPAQAPLGARPWRDRRFATLAAGASMGQFAQIGLLAHLYSLLVPRLGDTGAGYALSLLTVSAVCGRMAMAPLLERFSERRYVLCVNYAVQCIGLLLLWLAPGAGTALLLAAVALFGLGMGNATSMPPLIAQAEFTREDALRVVPLVMAVSQAAYAFAPALLGLVRGLSPQGGGVYACALLSLLGAMACFCGLRLARRP